MKRILILLTLVLSSLALFSQGAGEFSGNIKAGYQTNYKRFGIGFEGRYVIVDHVRLAPDVTFYFPKNKTWGGDINLNVQYVFDLVDGLSVYPIAGLNIANSRQGSQTIYDGLGGTIKTKSRGFTKWGFNLGVGADYYLTPKGYLMGEFKYTFSNLDYAQFMFGYGIKFW